MILMSVSTFKVPTNLKLVANGKTKSSCIEGKKVGVRSCFNFDLSKKTAQSFTFYTLAFLRKTGFEKCSRDMDQVACISSHTLKG